MSRIGGASGAVSRVQEGRVVSGCSCGVVTDPLR